MASKFKKSQGSSSFADFAETQSTNALKLNASQKRRGKMNTGPNKGWFWDQISLVVVASVTSWGGCRCDDLTSNLFRRDARMDAIGCRVGLVAPGSSAR